MRRLMPLFLLFVATFYWAEPTLLWHKPAVDNGTGQCVFYLPDSMPRDWTVERVVIVYDGRELTPDEQLDGHRNNGRDSHNGWIHLRMRVDQYLGARRADDVVKRRRKWGTIARPFPKL